MNPYLGAALLTALSAAVDALHLPAVLDTLVGHGALVGLQWLLACLCAARLPPSPRPGAAGFPLLTAVLCGGCGVALDLDHFAAARSLSLHSAMALAARPWGHSAAFLAALVAGAGAGAARGALPGWAPLLLGVAVGSHQMRDSIRRGALLWPAPPLATPPLPYPVYLAAMGLSVPALARALEGLAAAEAPALLPL